MILQNFSNFLKNEATHIKTKQHTRANDTEKRHTLKIIQYTQ